MSWKAYAIGHGGEDSEEIEAAYKEGCKHGYQKAMQEMRGGGDDDDDEGYGERGGYGGGYGERGGYGGGGYGGGMNRGGGGYGERRGVPGTGRYGRRYR